MTRLAPYALGAVLLVAACGEQRTAVRVKVTFPDGIPVDQIRVTLGSGTDPLVLPKRARALSSGADFVVLVPDSWAGTSVPVAAAGLSQGSEVVRGEGTATPKLKHVVTVTLYLCADECSVGQAECVVDQVRRCQQAGDCAVWQPPEDCPPAQPYCGNGQCAAQCQTECTTSGVRRCSGSGYQICGQYGSNPCLRWGPTLACGSGELCRVGDGACVPACDGGVCPCQTGQTQACADVGECHGGVRQCVGGQFGPCEWQVGPTAEVCDGKDNDCNGQTDDGLVAPACALQAGVCQGAVKRCGGSAGWLACTTADYAAHSSAYETTETSCDGKDNDCNGRTDEPAACCQPSCNGKACGADDGCGHACQDGTCPANASCWLGTCYCDGDSCGAGCCAWGDVCTGSTCCTPSCGSRVCGTEPTCGTSCGTCSVGTCNAQGQCDQWSPCFAQTDQNHFCWNYCITTLGLVCKGQCSGNGFNDVAAGQAYTLAGCQAGTFDNLSMDCSSTDTSYWSLPGYFRCCCAP